MTSPRQVSEEKDNTTPEDRLAVYCRAVRKAPNDTLEADLATDDRSKRKAEKSTDYFTKRFVAPTGTEERYLYARKTASDVVSETHYYLKTGNSAPPISKEGRALSSPADNKSPAMLARQRVMDRIKNWKCCKDTSPEKVLNQTIKCLQQNTAIVWSFKFNPAFVKEGLSDFQILNKYETKSDLRDVGYSKEREDIEIVMSSHLTKKTKKRFRENTLARFRYASFQLLEVGSPIQPITYYGSSFAVLRSVVRLGALYAPSDTLNNAAKKYLPCDFHHFEVMLDRAENYKLKAIIEWAVTGRLPERYNRQDYQEALIPAIDIFDPNLVEHIHIDQASLNGLSVKEQAAFQASLKLIRHSERGEMTVTCGDVAPYSHLTKELIGSVEIGDVVRTKEILKDHPVLLGMRDAKGNTLIQIAVENGYGDMIDLLRGKDIYRDSFEDKPAIRLLSSIASNQLSNVENFIMQKPNEILYCSNEELIKLGQFLISHHKWNLMCRLPSILKSRWNTSGLDHLAFAAVIESKDISFDKVKPIYENVQHVPMKNRQGKNPLIVAVECENQPVIKYFLKKQEIISEHNMDELMRIFNAWPVDKIYLEENVSLIEMVYARGESRRGDIAKLIHRAISANIKILQPYYVDKLIKQYSWIKELNGTADHKEPVLHLAIANKNASFDFIKEILTFFSPVFIENKEFYTPLYLAALHQRDDVFIYLLEHFSSYISKDDFLKSIDHMKEMKLSGKLVSAICRYDTSLRHPVISTITLRAIRRAREKKEESLVRAVYWCALRDLSENPLPFDGIADCIVDHLLMTSKKESLVGEAKMIMDCIYPLTKKAAAPTAEKERTVLLSIESCLLEFLSKNYTLELASVFKPFLAECDKIFFNRDTSIGFLSLFAGSANQQNGNQLVNIPTQKTRGC